MRVLFIGDICGRPGRTALARTLPWLREEYEPDLIVANVENAAHGLGITPKIADEILELGVDVMTGGNHLFDKKEVMDYLHEQPRLLRPANYAVDVPGYPFIRGEVEGTKYIVFTLVGRTFMQPIESPFIALDEMLELHAAGAPVRIVDFHAEATSEKYAMGRYCDGRISLLAGTHTHVQTADEQIFPGGTAFITDVGMTGPHDGVIGIRADLILKRFLTGLPVRFEPAEGEPKLHAVFAEVDGATGKASSVVRIQVADERF